MNELRISYEPDENGLGKITVRVRSKDFAGCGEAWIGAQEILEFAMSLKQYPLPFEPPMVLEVGYGGSADGVVKPQMCISTRFKPQGPLGSLLVIVRLQHHLCRDADAELFQAVETRLLTEYTAIEAFSADLIRLLSNKAPEAVLQAPSR